MIAAVNATLLDASISAVMTTLTSVYHQLNLSINWKKGKTEALVVYRGSGAIAHLNALRPTPSQPPSVQMPGSDERMTVVTDYKHLGGEIDGAGSLIPLARSHRKNAMAAYAPLATKVFGSRQVTLRFW